MQIYFCICVKLLLVYFSACERGVHPVYNLHIYIYAIAFTLSNLLPGADFAHMQNLHPMSKSVHVNGALEPMVDMISQVWNSIHWALVFVGQRLMFLLEKDKVLYAVCVTLLMCSSHLSVLTNAKLYRSQQGELHYSPSITSTDRY
jgi:predicted ABC-type exoprotein transport system permease subunit